MKVWHWVLIAAIAFAAYYVWKNKAKLSGGAVG